MPSSNVPWPIPLTRLRPWYPGQFGVPGTDTETGLRTDTNGAIFYVDPNAPGVSDARDGTDPTCPLQTVTAALTKCTPYAGDVIAVMAANTNEYANAALGRTVVISEEVTVNVPGVRIVGVCPSGSVGVWWNPASNGGTCITVYANDVLIEGFMFDEGTYTGCNAIYAEYDGTTYFADYLTIRNCCFNGTVDNAIQLEYAWYCDIHHNVFLECDAYGIYVDVAGSGIAYCQIHDNLFHDCGTSAMSLLGGCDVNYLFRNAIFSGNAQGGALATDEGINTTGGRENMVFDNWFSCLLPAGANGDINDLCTGSATDAWVFNHCTNGLLTTTPT